MRTICRSSILLAGMLLSVFFGISTGKIMAQPAASPVNPPPPVSPFSKAADVIIAARAQSGDFLGKPIEERRAVLQALYQKNKPGGPEVAAALRDADIRVRCLALDILARHPRAELFPQLVAWSVPHELPDNHGWYPPYWLAVRARRVITQNRAAYFAWLKGLMARGETALLYPALEAWPDYRRDRAIIEMLIHACGTAGKPAPALNELCGMIDPYSLQEYSDLWLQIVEDDASPVKAQICRAVYTDSIYTDITKFPLATRERMLAALRRRVQDPQCRFSALGLLAVLQDPRADDFLPWLSDQDANVQDAALRGMANCPDPAFIPRLLPLLKENRLRETALKALKPYRSPAVAAAVLPYCNRAPNGDINSLAVDILALQRDPKTVPVLLNAIVYHEHGETGQEFPVSREACLALAEMKEKKAIPLLLRHLSCYYIYEPAPCAHAASDALAIFGRDATAPLLQVMKDEKIRVGWPMAIRALGKIGDPTVIPQIWTLCKGQSEHLWDPQEVAAKTIAGFGDAGYRFLVKQADSAQADARAMAACGLGELPGDAVTDLLLKLLQDNEYAVRYYAAWSLVKRHDAKVILPLLRKAEYYLDPRDEMVDIDHCGVPHEWNQLESFTREFAKLEDVGLTEFLRAVGEDGIKRDILANTLGKMRDARAIRTMVEVEADARRLHEWLSTGTINGDQRLVALFALLQDDRVELRQSALTIIERSLGNPSMKDAGSIFLRTATADGDEQCRALALRCLQISLCPIADLAPLQRLLRHGTPLDQSLTALAFACQGDSTIIPDLQQRLKDTHPLTIPPTLTENSSFLLDYYSQSGQAGLTPQMLAIIASQALCDKALIPTLEQVMKENEVSEQTPDEERRRRSSIRSLADNAVRIIRSKITQE